MHWRELCCVADNPRVLQHLCERQAVARRLGEQLRGHARTARQRAGRRNPSGLT